MSPSIAKFLFFILIGISVSGCQSNETRIVITATSTSIPSIIKTSESLSTLSSTRMNNSSVASSATIPPNFLVSTTNTPLMETVFSTAAATPFPTAPPTSTQLPPPTKTTTPILNVVAPDGLIYQMNNGIWRINENGASARISDKPDAILSSTENKLLYIQNGDVFVADLENGEKRNVTRTADRIECCPKWWYGAEDTIVFGSWPETYQPFHGPFGDFEFGFLTIAKIDGSKYEVLDDQNPFYNWLAPAPYSSRLIYGDKLYERETGIQEFSTTGFSVSPTFDAPLREHISSPNWSHDGTLLAGYIYYQQADSNLNEGLAIFNFTDNTIHFVHDYQVYGTDTPPSLPIWSSDNSMIAFYARDYATENHGLWVVSIIREETLFSPSQNIQLDCRDEIVWSPKNNLVACAVKNRNEKEYWLIDIETEKIMRFEMPEGATLLDWQ